MKNTFEYVFGCSHCLHFLPEEDRVKYEKDISQSEKDKYSYKYKSVKKCCKCNDVFIVTSTAFGKSYTEILEHEFDIKEKWKHK